VLVKNVFQFLNTEKDDFDLSGLVLRRQILEILKNQSNKKKVLDLGTIIISLLEHEDWMERIFSKSTLREFWEIHAETEQYLKTYCLKKCVKPKNPTNINPPIKFSSYNVFFALD